MEYPKLRRPQDTLSKMGKHIQEHSDTGNRIGWMTYKKISLFLTPGPGNYCPINLTSLPIKIMEYKDRENIMKLLEDNGIVSRKKDGVEN